MATPAFEAIVEMGGTPTGGWVLLSVKSGSAETGSRAVRP